MDVSAKAECVIRIWMMGVPGSAAFSWRKRHTGSGGGMVAGDGLFGVSDSFEKELDKFLRAA